MKFARPILFNPENPMAGLGSWPEDRADDFGKGKTIRFWVVEHPDVFADTPLADYLKRKWGSVQDIKGRLQQQLYRRGIDEADVTVDCEVREDKGWEVN